MTLIPYNKTTSRYSDNKNWSKILFNKDRKLQTTELVEIQDLLENQIKKVTKNLYDFYNIVKGCKVLLSNIEKLDNNKRVYNYILTPGQLFIELKEASAFIDTPSLNFTVSNVSGVIYIGVTFKVEILKNDNSTRDVFSGGEVFGELGADRLVITPNIQTFSNVEEGGGFYPIAIIKPKSQTFLNNYPEEIEGPPDIFYYRNNEVVSQTKDSYLPIFIEKKLSQVLHEISGDFIAEGLDISYQIKKGSLDSFSLVIKVDPGIAYITGKRYFYSYVFYKEFKYDDDLIKSLFYIYITEEGLIKVKFLKEDEVQLYSPEENSLALATLLVDDLNNIKTIPSKNLMPEISDIVKLHEQQTRNKEDLLDLSLRIDELLGVKRGFNLTGILSDSFSSLKNSNTSHPLYNASITPSIQAITLPFNEVVKNRDTFTIVNEQDLEVYRDQNRLMWSSVASTEDVIIKNLAQTTSIKLGVSDIVSANLEVSPNVVYLKDQTTNVSYLKSNIIESLQTNKRVKTNIKTSKKFKEVEFLISATGFSQLEDNITLKIDSKTINSAILLKGTEAGSSSGTYKANQAGHINLRVTHNINTDNNIVYVYLESNKTQASNQIKLVNLTDKRSSLDESILTPCVSRSSSILSGICSVFNITQSISLRGLEIILTEFNNSVSQNRSILDVYLTKTRFGLPTDEVIAKGSLFLLDGIPTLQSFVPIIFDRVAVLETGEYAIIFNTTYENLSLSASLVGENLQSTGFAGSFNVVENTLYSFNKDAWEELNETLTLKLIKRLPSSRSATTSILVEDIEEFNALEVNIPIQITPSSFVNVEVDKVILNNSSHFFKEPVKSAIININTLGTINNHPILELDNLNINLFSYENNGTWVSINKEFIRPYNFVEISFDAFIPPNTSFEVYFSSNQGQSWEILSEKNIQGEYIYLEELKEVNRSLPLFNYKFKIEDLLFTTFNNETIERTQLMVRIDLSADTLENLPFFKNLIALTY